MGLSVCLSVKPHLTSGAFVHPEIDVTYSTGNEGQKICGTAPLRRSITPSVVWPAYSAKVQAFLGLKRLTISQRLPGIRECDTATYLSLSAALVSVPCLAIFLYMSRYSNSLHFLPFYVLYTSVISVHFISACSDCAAALRVCTLVLFILSFSSLQEFAVTTVGEIGRLVSTTVH